MKVSFTVTAGASSPRPYPGARCRIHGPGCGVPWGYDRDHTDSDLPYTLAELAERTDCPHFYAYPTSEDYLEGWNLWRALRRDDRLSGAEADVKWQLVQERIYERLRAEA